MTYLQPTQRLSPSFTVASLSPTNTGINNTPANDYLKNLTNLAQALEKLKSKLGSFRIASGYRNPLVNTAVGGSSTSRHMNAEAVDIVPSMQHAEKYWAAIINDPELKSLFGEISYKKHQGSIHLTLPYFNSYGFFVKASPRIADDTSGKVVYRSLNTESINEYMQKYGFALSTYNPVVASIGSGFLYIGAGVLLLALAIKKRR